VAIDPARRTVEIDGVEVHLTPTEFRLLLYLAGRPDRLVGHHELLRAVWGSGYDDDNHLLQVTMRSLRGRIAQVTDQPVIETAYGAGYRMARSGRSQGKTADRHRGSATLSGYDPVKSGVPGAAQGRHGSANSVRAAR
jgi:DNA-binding winged helix-turn-helix (wHTH) protein